MKKFLVAAAAGAVCLVPAGLAHADSNDDNFVAAMKKNGVEGDTTAMINIAHQVCDGLASSDPDTIRDALVSQLQLKPNRAAIFVAQAVGHYCPQYGNLTFKTPSS
ncbi:MAG: DUF732 domain-containing protein [Fimbriimonadaceae bacterium]|nr:DUF732 domain-containing protein [Fimbriimonadaceae bacterium]